MPTDSLLTGGGEVLYLKYMVKKIVLAVLVLGLFGGGFFYWWNSQADVRELNKTLPKGVSVAKSLVGNEYKVINKIDGYEFKAPKEWRGVKEIEYMPEREEMGFRGTSINIEGLEGGARGMGIDRFKIDGTTNLIDWAENMFNVVGLTGDFINETIGRFEIAKTQENVHLGGMYMYFFKKDSVIYSITNGSEDYIRYIIANGKW